MEGQLEIFVLMHLIKIVVINSDNSTDKPVFGLGVNHIEIGNMGII